MLVVKAGPTDLYVEQLSTFSGPVRDPRGWSASVAYLSIGPADALAPALERPGLELVPVDAAGGMPFGHDRILDAAVDRLRGKGAYSDLPARLLPSDFTLAELYGVYQIALGCRSTAMPFDARCWSGASSRRAATSAGKRAPIVRPWSIA